MEEVEISLNKIEIAPLEKKHLRGAFSDEDGLLAYEEHLVEWFRTKAWENHAEKCSKTFVILLGKKVIGYFAVVTSIVETLKPEKYRSANHIQVIRLAKLYEQSLARFSQNAEDAKRMATDPLGPAPADANIGELAAWTVVGNVLLNLDETLMKR